MFGLGFDYAVYDAVLDCLFWTHEEIPLRIPLDSIQRLSSVGSEDLVELLSNLDNFAGVDLDVSCLTPNTSHWLV